MSVWSRYRTVSAIFVQMMYCVMRNIDYLYAQYANIES